MTTQIFLMESRELQLKDQAQAQVQAHAQAHGQAHAQAHGQAQKKFTLGLEIIL